MATIACVYKVSCGEHFYIGSTSNLDRRRRDHEWRLKRGIHPVPELQKAFDDGGKFSIMDIPGTRVDPNSENLRDILRSIEQEKLDHQFSVKGCCNRSPNARGPNNGEMMKDKWKDPEFREKMTSFLKSRKGVAVTEETRSKMATAKRGARNANSREVIVTHPDGSITRFPCVSDAAKFFRVSQQLMDMWIKGTVSWPGTGKITREQNKWISDYSAKLAS